MYELPIEEKIDNLRDENHVLDADDIIDHNDETVIINEQNDEVWIYIILTDLDKWINTINNDIEEMLQELRDDEHLLSIEELNNNSHCINIILDENNVEVWIYLPIDDIDSWVNI